MKTFVISYLSKAQLIVLNVTIESTNLMDAIAEVREDALIILSTVCIARDE